MNCLEKFSFPMRSRPKLRLQFKAVHGFGNNRSGTLLPDTLRPALGPGERAAISLAAEVKASTIILDEEPARKVAVQLKIPIIGTAGVLVLAKDLKLIVAVKTRVDALIEH